MHINGKTLQCKHIPTLQILQHLRQHGGIGCTHWEYLEGHDVKVKSHNIRTVVNAMPPTTPPRLVLAKMQSLVNRGLVDGCDCGCRGDWELTDEGEAELTRLENLLSMASNL